MRFAGYWIKLFGMPGSGRRSNPIGISGRVSPGTSSWGKCVPGFGFGPPFFRGVVLSVRGFRAVIYGESVTPASVNALMKKRSDFVSIWPLVTP